VKLLLPHNGMIRTKGRRKNGTTTIPREMTPTKQEIAEGIKRLNGTYRKYRNEPADCRQGHTHPSGVEAGRCNTLHFMLKAGTITDLEIWPQFKFEHNGVYITRYTADFAYTQDGERKTEDVKGGNATKTEGYKLRKRLMLAFYGIEILET
jgi:hypothetical protein